MVDNNSICAVWDDNSSSSTLLSSIFISSNFKRKLVIVVAIASELTAIYDNAISETEIANIVLGITGVLSCGTAKGSLCSSIYALFL